ncbi:MAG: helix-turn-helix transcriptional regulator [Gammaproteobacteria bacterium]|nr:helix-turn-helix transcriptional regulator [Gammaproteobacteria bacterium]
MATSSSLVKLLKKQIRTQGFNYQQIAAALDLSESAVKRMFSTGNMSLRRVDAICEVLGLDMSDLLGLMEQDRERVDELSETDEQKLVDDPRLLLVAYCMVNHWTFADILKRWNLSEAEVVLCLAELDRMKMLELLPGNRVKTLVSNNFKWQPHGPIERFFRSQVQQEFLGGEFSVEGDLHLVKNGDISRTAKMRLRERLKIVGDLFDDITVEERRIPADERHGTTMVLAIRQWQYAAFRQFERT